MAHRSLALCGSLLLSAVLFAQHPSKYGIALRAWLKTADPAAPIDLFLQGDAAAVERAASLHGATVKGAISHWVNVRMPAGRVDELQGEGAIQSIYVSIGRPHTLNDSMRVKTRIDQVQLGIAPLMQPYDGDGVIMGIVDTGLDFHHPDFIDSLGHTRVLRYWDQNYPFSAQLTPQPYGYGQAWDNTAIDAGNCPTTEPANQFGHGTTVVGTAAGNGHASGHYIGAAPKSDIIIVATNFNAQGWTSTVVDAIDYIFSTAAALGRPAVVNLSLGDYLGSHDGLDPAALMIDDLLTGSPGRAVVCAGGNSGCFAAPYQLHLNVGADTTMTWFDVNNSSLLGVAAAYMDFWADTAAMNNVWYSVGADRYTGGYAYRGRIPFRNIQGGLDTFVEDTLWSVDHNRLGVVTTYASLRGGQYHLEVALIQPDSAGLHFRFMATGNGVMDCWSAASLGTSNLVSTGLPDAATFPPIAHYVAPTLDRVIVDAWACSPHVITVANYCNEVNYIAANGTAQSVPGTEGDIAACSSHGPTRTGLLKPDVASPGDITFSAAPLPLLQAFIAGAGISRVAPDSMHIRAGGTSIASPSVAGAAALYLQKCPLATHQEIIAAITGHAFGDGFTGTLPNNTWGHGKLDAFAALVGSNFSAQILAMDTTVCMGDSLQLSGQPDMSSYLWSTGGTDMDTYASQGTVTLQEVNASGCVGAPDSVQLVQLPAPAQPTITPVGAQLTSTPAFAYQWSFNGTPIPDATTQIYMAEHTGDYTVTVTNPEGCSATSAPVQVVITGVDAASSAPAIALWPTPAVNELHLTLPFPDACTCAILDTKGAVLRQAALAAGRERLLPLTGLASGTYLLRIDHPAGPVTLRFTVR